MPQVTSLFAFSVKDLDAARAARKVAHAGFSDTEGLLEWQTLETVSAAKGHLFLDLFRWRDDEAANAGNDVFSGHADTLPYLAQVDEIKFARAFQ